VDDMRWWSGKLFKDFLVTDAQMEGVAKRAFDLGDATTGVDSKWEANGDRQWPKLAKAFKDATAPVEAMFYEMHKRGLAINLTKYLVELYIRGAQLNLASWATSSKASGRCITNCGAGGKPPLNTPEVKAATDELYGGIGHPTIGDFTRMIFDYFEMLKAKNPEVEWGDMVLYKLDLAGAYTLVSFTPEDVRKMAVELSDDVVMFFLCGHFGWTGTPGAFQTVTRGIVWELNNGILAGMYVDDILGVCLRKDLNSELAKAKKLLTDLLGEKAVAEHKTEARRRLAVIGYVIDLDKELVAIAERNALRALHGYMTTDLTGKHPVKFLQKLASWGSRYGKICRHMRPFVRYLYRAYAGRKQYASVELDASGRLVVRLFRTLFMLGLCSAKGGNSDVALHVVLCSESLHSGGGV
jgi:hypothetical protein